MISVSRPRRGRRITLVGIDGTSVARPVRSISTRDHALGWPAWTDNFHYEPGECREDLASHVMPDAPEPDDHGIDGACLWAQLLIESSLPPVETDAAFLARLEAQDAAERERIAETYFPTTADLADYCAWLESMDEDGNDSTRFTVEEWSAIRRGQVTTDELAAIAAGLAVG